MTRRSQAVLSTLFCLFTGGFLLLHLALPDRAFSPGENRLLQALPALTPDSVAGGGFMTRFEDYTADQFPLRDFWVGLKAGCERIAGKRENNEVYFGKDDTLLPRVAAPAPADLLAVAGRISQFAAQVEAPVHFGLIPSAAWVWRDRLPPGAPTAQEGALISAVYGAVDAETLDVEGALARRKDEALYYRTDHHWTSLGAYYGYLAVAEGLGFEPLPLSYYEKTTVSQGFLGTLHSSAGAWWIPPDEVDAYVPSRGVSVTSYFTGTPEPGALYVPDYLERKDQYSYFLGGVQPLCVIQTASNGPVLLLIRDSYADCLVPFLTPHFSEIHLVDLRYYHRGAASYAQEIGADVTLILLGVKGFAAEQTLPSLAR